MLTHRIAGTLVLLIAASICAHAEAIYVTTTTNTLVTFDSATPGTVSAVSVSGLQSGESLSGIDVRPATGEIYGFGSTGNLYVIDPVTGNATLVGGVGVLVGNVVGFDFDPVGDAIHVVNNDVGLGLIAVDGSVISTLPLGGTATELVGLAHTNNVPGALATQLYGIDAASSSLYLQSDGGFDLASISLSLQGGTTGNEAVFTLVGPLGVTIGDLVGFDIQAGTGAAYAALTPPGGSTSSLYTINLVTGQATLVGDIGFAGGPVNGLTVAAAVPVPEPPTWVMLISGVALSRGIRRLNAGRVMRKQSCAATRQKRSHRC
jgi:hypothetical protein